MRLAFLFGCLALCAIPALTANANILGFGSVLTRSMSARGEMYLDDATGLTLTVTNAGTYYKLTSSSALAIKQGFMKFVSSDLSNGHGDLIIQEGGNGIYRVNYTVSFQSSAPNILGTSYIYVNEVPQANCTTTSDVAVASKSASTGKTCLLKLVAGDVISFRATSSSSGTVFTTKKFNINLTRVDSSLG